MHVQHNDCSHQPIGFDSQVPYSWVNEPNNSVYAAVFDYKIGNKNLHQCADASIYLNARFKYDNNY